MAKIKTNITKYGERTFKITTLKEEATRVGNILLI